MNTLKSKSVTSIHAMDEAEWKRSSPERRAHWLRNHIAFIASKGSAISALEEYWLGRYEKRLATIGREVIR